MTSSRRILSAVIVLAALSAGCASGTEDEGSTSSGDKPADYSTIDCAETATESVRISAESNDAVKLLKVRDFKLTKDNRTGFKKPATGEAVLLTCRGTGVWSDSSTTPLALTTTVDSDGDVFFAYEPL